jgi:uncharacterized C2H2 Zn-finger protein
MLSKKLRKSETSGYEDCPECGAVKRYAICVRCGWMDEKTKKKDRELRKSIEQDDGREKPKVKRKSWRPL